MFSLSLTAQSEEQQKLQHRADKYNQQQVIVSEPLLVRPYAPYAVPVYRRPYAQPSTFYGTSRLHGSLGLSLGLPTSGQPTTFGLYATLGQTNRLYLHARSSKSNPYNHYPNISLYEVNQWQDQLKEVFINRTDIGIGIAIKQLDRFYHILGINIYHLDRDLVYLDETLILPYPLDQYYSIDGDTKTSVNILYGLMYQPTSRLELSLQGLVIGHSVLQVSLGYNL